MRISDWSSDVCSSVLLADGPATIVAKTGAYNMETETVAVPGTVQVKGANGYRIDASNVAVDLNTRSLAGEGGVEGTLNIGRFSANRLTADLRSEEHTSELQSLMRISYAVFCLKKKKNKTYDTHTQLVLN